MGNTLLWMGELNLAGSHLQEGETSYTLIQRSAFVQDPKLSCLVYRSWVLWLQGYPDQARAKVDAALGLAKKLNHLFDYAFAHTVTSFALLFCRDEHR